MGAAFGPYVQWHDRAWHWIAALDPDLALLQECVPPNWARERWTVLNLPFRYWASAIVAKPEVQAQPIEPDPESLLGRFGSYLATATICGEGAEPLLVASVHTRAAESPVWVTDGHDRTAMARASVGTPWSNDVAFAAYDQMRAGRPFLIGGDWNTARWIDEDGHPEPMGAEFFDRAAGRGWVDISLDETGREGRTWYGPGGPRPVQLDHLFADTATASSVSGYRIEPYPVEALGLSDHAPIILETTK
jgi:hypothetical protein